MKTLILSLILLNIRTIQSNTDVNNSEIFIAYSGHNEAKENVLILPTESNTDYTNLPPEAQTKPEVNTKAEEDIVFIPNDKPVIRNEDEYLVNEPVRIDDMMNNRRLGDVMRDDPITEAANEDIFFISGKNNENVEQSVIKDKQTKHTDTYTKIKDTGEKRKRLDCSNLDCSNTMHSVCGGKMESRKWKYRLFMNECFFRKVNCAFRYPVNRYKKVEPEKCSHIGHSPNRRQFRQYSEPISMPLTSKTEEKQQHSLTRRTFLSRRSLNADINGQGCAHPCPVMCTEKYEPQCAVSSTGQRHTFINHCKLDYNSCLNNVVWYIRPLSECVGGKKADVQQNRGFIAWMQKVGIVDGRGRLTINKGAHPKLLNIRH